MDYGKLLSHFKGKSVLVVEATSLADGLLDLMRHLENQPRGWGVHFCPDGEDLRRALQSGKLHTDSVVVIPSDMDFLPGECNLIASKQGIRLVIVVGHTSRKHEDRYKAFYYIQSWR